LRPVGVYRKETDRRSMKLPVRKSPRLPTYDYRGVGIYFVTVCTHLRRCVFGEVDADSDVHGAAAVRLNPLGEVARDEWLHTLALRPYVDSHACTVMPNHVHLLFGLWSETGDDRSEESGEADGLPAAHRFGNHGAASVSSIVGTYKAAVTRSARRLGLWEDARLWQPRYHERIVRNDREHGAIYEYIVDNPRRWQEDRYRTSP
jgi:putative transposase